VPGPWQVPGNGEALMRMTAISEATSRVTKAYWLSGVKATARPPIVLTGTRATTSPCSRSITGTSAVELQATRPYLPDRSMLRL
jgi:hypothetical protein